jgi:hypothetical protein
MMGHRPEQGIEAEFGEPGMGAGMDGKDHRDLAGHVGKGQTQPLQAFPSSTLEGR